MRSLVSLVSIVAVAGSALATVSVAEREDPTPSGPSVVMVDKPLWREREQYYSTLRAPRVAPDRRRRRRCRTSGASPRPGGTRPSGTTRPGFPPAARGAGPTRGDRRAERAAARSARMQRPAASDGHARQAAHAAGRVRPGGERRLLRLGEAERPVRPGRLHHRARRHACSAARCTTSCRTRRPAAPGRDNNTFWVPDFSPSHYNKLIYSEEGLTQRVRPDLNGGVDLRGYTVRNHYLEMSKGKYEVDGHGHAVADAPALRGVVLRRLLRGRRRPATSATPTTRAAPARWSIDAVQALHDARAGLPVRRLRRRGPGRPGRRRRPVRARRRARPRRARPRRRRPGRRRRRAGDATPSGPPARPSTRRPAASRCPAPASRSSTTPPSPRTPAWA